MAINQSKATSHRGKFPFLKGSKFTGRSEKKCLNLKVRKFCELHLLKFPVQWVHWLFYILTNDNSC